MNVNTAQPKIFLIGMMGSGKSYWSLWLSKKLKVPAYDLDHLIEIMEERTIAEIFEQSGEEYFRKEEVKMLKLFKEKKSFILSCGGGTPCFFDNMEWMNKHGISIWIDEPIDTLVTRLLPEKDHRPLIKKLDKNALAVYLQNKLEERSVYYQQSTYHLKGVQISGPNLLNLVKKHA